MVKKLSNFDVLVQELECQLLNDEEQLLLLAGKGNGISLLGSNNCSCQGNNCKCANNCECYGNRKAYNYKGKPYKIISQYDSTWFLCRESYK